MISGVGLLLLVVIVGVIVAGATIGRSSRPVRDPSPRTRRIVRYVTGSVGVMIIAALVVVTWLDVRGTDDFAEDAPPTVHLPTKSVEQIIDEHPEWVDQGPQLKSARLLFHVLVIGPSKLTPHLLHLEELEIDWPKDRIAVQEIRAPGCDGTLEIEIDHVEIRRRERPERPTVWGQYDIDFRGSSGGSAGQGGVFVPGGAVVLSLSRQRGSWLSLLSALPAAEVRAYAYLLIFTHLAEADDPLRPAPATELIEGEAAQSAVQTTSYGVPVPLDLEYGADLPPAFVLIGRTGLSFLLVLLAGMLTARLFRRYAVGLLVTFPVLILAVIACDRAALAYHQVHLTDDAQPMDVRRLAAVKTASTFFFKRTASQALIELATSERTPAELVDLAWPLARALTASEAPFDFDIRGSHGGSRGDYLYDLYTDQDYQPVLMLVGDGSTYVGSRDLAYIALSQEGTFRRIVTFDETLAARVIGTEKDFETAAQGLARDGYPEQSGRIWDNVIVPAVAALERDSP